MALSSRLSHELAFSRTHTDSLFQLIDPHALYDRPIPERHRMIFYFGHLEAFDWNQIRQTVDVPSFNPGFDKLFEAGIDPEPGQLPSDKPSDWPSAEEVFRYRAQVRENLEPLLAGVSPDFVRMIIEHRDMHAETFAYILHNLSYEKKKGPSAQPTNTEERAEATMIDIPAGVATLGKNRGESFGWDNEFEELRIEVPAFSISKHKVTNGEYLEYVQAGNAPPHFWSLQGDRWFYRGMFEEYPLPLDAPVYVTKEQAEAYAEWRGKSLPTEAQFHRAAYGAPDGSERSQPWADDPGNGSRGNFGFMHWDPVPVNATPGGDSAFGVAQLVGNGWEWTSTVFAPFPGFQAAPNYPGYSANFFDDRHYVIKGASPRTSNNLVRRPFRNWFRPNYPYIYTTFRLVDN